MRLIVVVLAIATGSACTAPSIVVRSRNYQHYWEGIESDNLAMVTGYLADGSIGLNERDSSGNHALHHAARMNSLKVARFLIVRGADIDGFDRRQRTPLTVAALCGHVGMMELLISLGADLELGDPLYRTAAAGLLEPVRTLIEAGADTNRRVESGMTPLHAAVATEHADVVRLLLANGAKSDVVAEANGVKATPYDVAAAVGNADLLSAFEGESPRMAVGVDASPQSPATGQTSASPLPKEPESHNQKAIPLMEIRTGEIRRLAALAVRERYSEIDLDAYEPSFVICLSHPKPGVPEAPIIVEWLGKASVVSEQGEDPALDRRKYPKLQVMMTREGNVLDIVSTFTWLYRDVKANAGQ